MIKVHLIFLFRYSILLGSLFQFIETTRGCDSLNEDEATYSMNLEEDNPFGFLLEGGEVPPYDYSENSDQTNLGSEYSSDSNKRKARDELQHISKKQKFDITFEEYPSDYMIQSPEEDIFKYPYDEEHIKSQIIYEINNKNEREALLLLENNNTISMLYSTETNPLLLAAQHGMVDIVQYCFENHLNLALISKDSTGKTAIHFACIEGHLDVVKYLTKNHNDSLFLKCNLHFRPLEYAIYFKKNNIIEYFSNNNPILFFQHELSISDTLINFCMKLKQYNILFNILMGCVKNKDLIQSQNFKDVIVNEIDANFIEYISLKTKLSFQEECVIYLLADLAPYTAQADVITTMQKNPYFNNHLKLSFKSKYMEFNNYNLYRESVFIKNLIYHNKFLKIIPENEFNCFKTLIRENLTLQQNNFFLSSNHRVLINDFDEGNKGMGINVIVCDYFIKPPKESQLNIYNEEINNNIYKNDNNNLISFKNINYHVNANDGAHGVMVSGVITNNITGIAPNSKIIPHLPYFLNKIMAEKFDSKIINMSFSIFESNIIHLNELCKNHIVVLSAGNNGHVVDNEYQYLIKSNEDVRKHLFLVSNIMRDGVTLNPTSSYFSEDGAPDQMIEDVGITAPGTDIVTCLPENGIYSYTIASGTSFSAPIVTGAIAKLMSDFPILSITEIANLVRKGANCSGVYTNRGKFGCGLLDIKSTYIQAEEYIRIHFPNFSVDEKIQNEIRPYSNF